jgi:hypothetical protein
MGRIALLTLALVCVVVFALVAEHFRDILWTTGHF